MFNENNWYYFDEEENLTKKIRSEKLLNDLWRSGKISSSTKIFNNSLRTWTILQETDELCSLLPGDTKKQDDQNSDLITPSPTEEKVSIPTVEQQKKKIDKESNKAKKERPKWIKKVSFLFVGLFLVVGLGVSMLLLFDSKEEPNLKQDQQVEKQKTEKDKKEEVNKEKTEKKKVSVSSSKTYVSKYTTEVYKEPTKKSKSVATTMRGESITIYKTKTVNKVELWGQLASGNWVCMKDEMYEYLVDEETYKQYELHLQEERKKEQIEKEGAPASEETKEEVTEEAAAK